MDARMYLVNERTGHVARLASFRYSTGWTAIAVDDLGKYLEEAFLLAQANGEHREDEWRIGYEGDPIVQKYLNERHPVGLRH